MSLSSVDFEEIFQTGLNDSTSPYIKIRSKTLSKNLTLKAAIVSAALLLVSFISSFYNAPVANFLLLFVYFFAGLPALIESIEDLKKFNINIDVLMTLAAFFSILIGSATEGGLLLVLFALSGAMEDAAMTKTSKAIKELNELGPKTVDILLPSNQSETKSVKDVLVGQIMTIKAGQTIPLDGKVIWGTSSVDLSHLTGESIPQFIEKESLVPAGAKNIDGALHVEITKKSADSTLSKIIHLITEAQNAKPKSERFLDKIGRPYSITIIVLAAICASVLPFFLDGQILGDEGSVYRALAFLIAASPCALIIATPTAYLSAISACARKGVLLKGGVTLDALAKCEAVAFDKTGTLTTAELKLDKIILPSTAKLGEQEYLQIAASLETHSSHPMAKAILANAQEKKINLLPLDSTKELPGIGIEAKFKNHSALIGHTKHVLQKVNKTNIKMEEDVIKGGQSLCALLIDGEVVFFTFIDEIKQEAKQTIDELKKVKIKSYMLTGDHEQAAKRIADHLELDEYFANLKPEDKLQFFDSHEKTIMVGDGINDAPALARASVGISMGTLGSDSAIEASDVVFINDNVSLTSWLLKKAKKTKSIVFQNLFFALVIIVVTSLSALAGIVPLWLAVILHEGGTVLVALNGLRLLSTR